ncbi:type IV pilus modification protein PilV [Pseudomonas petrae]|uniref:Type IV pilus modification protein PilV n=1 Tax=Pseudomonas petrae TaxID=2912190 RepID=A0ABS9IDZ8_9PSED|nr:type IV pilus modification protein PilV [Pseudomonas petrae]MCF7531954.1 type IV pilus modification protein PilV [Pseudomonas petrae]MCF7537517.1 type IV pilus modification protein PilV [Pseudomonas petrae]MCF7545711.1 type IV pilus modification protein PilV [Pseudomonas petrae]MCF7556726.1 type IV pilus modification protein PilV [Pseudomonas petrae]
MNAKMTSRQKGTTLIEVLVSLLVLAIGLLGAAALQLNALKYTDSSRTSSQASFIAYDMMDRIRANPDVDYQLASLSAAPSGGDLNVPRTQDLYDFKTNIQNLDLATGDGSIVVNKREVTITVSWSDARAANKANTLQTFMVKSRVAIDTKVAQ